MGMPSPAHMEGLGGGATRNLGQASGYKGQTSGAQGELREESRGKGQGVGSKGLGHSHSS